MKVKEGFMLREVAGNYIVVPVGKTSENFRGLITLNSTGAFLWKTLETSITKDELLTKLLSEYEVTEEIAKNDIEAFINKLLGAGLIE